MAIGKLWSVTLDCAEPQPLADFWAKALDGSVAYTSENFIGVETPGGLWIGAYRIDGYQPPVWPDGAPPKQFHLDFAVDDLDAAERAALELGATKSPHQPNPESWRVFLDPAGHPFCLSNADV
ncbi:MAG TPA: VOC family protein [Jatrophihabitans sp.]|nr:VOC family protein [Jatrophihabitans sp.]